jgi:hypothetical protein
MRPFQISEASKKIIDTYPPAEILREVTPEMTRGEISNFVRLWVSEGLPYAFRGIPIIYESVRDWLRANLDIHPKSITMIGSARIGYSMRGDEFGRPFGPESNLDLSIILEKYFNDLSEKFNQWKDDFVGGTITPKKNREREYWPNNVKEIPRNIFQGFIDPYKIPNRTQYPIASKSSQLMYVLKGKLSKTDGAPKVKETSIRAYRNWQAFENRVVFNFKNAIPQFQTSARPS